MAEITRQQTRYMTRAEFEALDKTTVDVGTEICIVDQIQKEDLSTDLQNTIDKAVLTDTDQTVTGVKTFSDHIKTPQVANTDGKALVRYKETEVKSVFGNDSTAAVLMGNTDRPYYSKSGSDFTGSELALKSDVVTPSWHADASGATTSNPAKLIRFGFQTIDSSYCASVYTETICVAGPYYNGDKCTTLRDSSTGGLYLIVGSYYCGSPTGELTYLRFRVYRMDSTELRGYISYNGGNWYSDGGLEATMQYYY